MALGEYDPTGFFSSPDQFLSPAMGRLLAQNPESLIPHFAAQGVAPPTQMAENFGGRFGASNDAPPPYSMPSSGALPAPSPYAPPASAGPAPVGPHFGLGDVQQKASDYYGSLVPDWLKKGFSNAAQYGAGASAAPAPSTKIPDRIKPSTSGRVPPEALGQPQDTGDLRDEGPPGAPPYAPSKLLDVVSPETASAAAPASPETAAAGTKSTPMSPELRKLIDSVSGVRPPPAPPTPVLHPEVGRAAAPVTGSPVASFLAEILSGKGVSPNTLRLLQAVGGK